MRSFLFPVKQGKEGTPCATGAGRAAVPARRLVRRVDTSGARGPLTLVSTKAFSERMQVL